MIQKNTIIQDVVLIVEKIGSIQPKKQPIQYRQNHNHRIIVGAI